MSVSGADVAGEPLPTEYVELCEEHKVDTTYAPPAPPMPVKKAPAKKAPAKKAAAKKTPAKKAVAKKAPAKKEVHLYGKLIINLARS